MIDHGGAAFRAETHAFAAALAGLPVADWERQTRCTPWLVRDVVAHVVLAVDRLPQALAAAPPETADTGVVAYYRAGDRSSRQAAAERVHAAQVRAAGVTPATLIGDLITAARAVDERYRCAPERIVWSPHGDAMLVGDFLTTRVVEVAVHGLDVADALNLPPWLTPAARDLLPGVLLGPDWHTLGWDPVTLLRAYTGRMPVSPEQAFQLAHLGAGGLSFG